MSTVLILVELERDASRLCRFEFARKGREQEWRQLTMSASIGAWLAEAPLADDRVATRGHFRQFASGQPIDDCDFMKRVEDRRAQNDAFEHGVWAMRPRFDPQYRFFGMFAIKDWFVVLTKESRDCLERDKKLWMHHIDECRRIWYELFPGRDPWVAMSLSNFVSNAEKCDDRW